MILATAESVQKPLGEFEEKLDSVIKNPTVGADTWHRRLQHTDFQSMEKLHKIDSHGVDYADTFKGRDIYAVTKL